MEQTNFYRDRNFAVSLWDGTTGEDLPIEVTEPALRADFACFTICVRGALHMVKPSGKIGWYYVAGSTSLDGGDFDEIGIYKWTPAEPVTQELCFSLLNPDTGLESDLPFVHDVFRVKAGEKVEVPIGSLLVVAKGSFDAGLPIREPILLAPHFARVDSALTIMGVEATNVCALVRTL